MDKLERRKVLKDLVILALPVVIEEILATLLSYVDTAMVGRLGEIATASVNLTTSINWLIGSVFGAAGIAVVAIISKGYGAQDWEKVKDTSSHVLWFSLVLGTLIGTLAILLSPYIPIWMGSDIEIHEMASMYFRIISIPMIFRCLSRLCASALRAVKNTKTPMIINLSSNLLNVILNYILIYKVNLGVKGAAIATAISFTVMGGAQLVFMMDNEILKPRFRGFRFNKTIVRETLQIGLPALATSAASCMGHVVFAGLVSSMGTTVFAAHSIALSAESMFYVPGYGFRSASSTLIGISVGEQNEDKFRTVERQSIIITVIMMAFNGAMLFLFARPIMEFFTPSQAVILQGAQVLRLIAISEPLFGLMIATEGIYYGLGQTKYTFIIETIGAWAIRIFFTIICVKVLHTNLFKVWICMFADNSFRALALFFPILMGRDKKMFEKRARA